tara:strand:+ start:179 stop:340 length:162 start_codon:yes stop_codon:yes gene_type:complete
MFEREQKIAFFIAMVCMVSFFGIMWITFPSQGDTIFNEYEIDGYSYNCERIMK